MFTHTNGYWEVYRHFLGDFLAGGRGLCGEKFPWKNLSWGKRISMKGGQDSFKSNEKINMKKFLQLKVRSSIRTLKRTEITHMRGSPPPNTLLFTLKVTLLISTI